MFKYIIVFAGFFLSIHLKAQTGIGTTTPHASAKLDVSANNKGFLPPRVTLTSNTDATTIPSPAEGLLVYNLGSVGLQAGYYYWNNANWATIATATSAGNGVTASDMVKIYDGVGNAATINTNGAPFSVTTSGKYSFDISTSATCNNCMVTLNFQVRDGSNSNAVIGSDYQTSYNNNVHAEYNGKVEVNLIAGRSYNVLVTASSGGIYNNDYTRVYMKQVSGNLPVTGQSVDYIQASLSANQALSATGNINFNSSSGTGITITSGGFNLIANKTYKLEAAIGGASAGYAYYGWVDNSNNLLPGGSIGAVIKAGNTHTDAPQDKAVVYFTPTVDTRVFLRVYNLSGTLTAYAPSFSTNFSSTWASIQQVGSSAIINPWTLSGTNTFNTTGNVGIGNNAPTAKLDVTGSLGVSGSGTFRTIGGDEGGEIEFGVPQTNTTLSTRVVTDVWQNRYRIFDGNTKGVYIDLSKAPTGVGGELLTKASGLVNRGVDVTLGNLKARVAASGNASLQLSTVSGTYSIYGSGVHVFTSNLGSATIDGASPRTISTTPAYLVSGNTFPTAGGTDTWNIMDTSNSIAWRITMILGAGVNNNLITIERLF
jgi:hypothetical protein